MNIRKKIGEKIKRLRETQGWKTAHLAQKSGIRKEYIEKIEKGKAKRLTVKHIYIFTKIFNISIEKFFDFEEIENFVNKL